MGKSFVYNTGASDDDKKDDELRVEFGVFIDGTLNNLKNTETRKIIRGETDEDVVVDTKSKKYEDDLKREALHRKAILNGAILEDNRLEKPKEYTDYIKSVERTFIDQLGTDNSFSNDYTNVARMFMCCEKDYRIYVPGMGTNDLKRDADDGFMFGKGPTGIRGRVKFACEEVGKKIQAKKNEEGNDEKIITEITLDVFGFSRGAASARNFVYEVTKSAYKPKTMTLYYGTKMHGDLTKNSDPYGVDYANGINNNKPKPKNKEIRKILVNAEEEEIDPKYLEDGYMPKFGHLGTYLLGNTDLEYKDLENISITIRFVGIYDTVSSYDEKGTMFSFFGYNFDNDVKELHLNSLRCQKLVHFTAKDEHRKNFVLTHIKTGKNAIEKNFPGVHCDIGGAYENGPETIDEIGTSLKDNNYIKRAKWLATAPLVFKPLVLFTKSGLEELKDELIEEYWYNPDELLIQTQKLPRIFFPPSIGGMIKEATSYEKLTGTKKMVRKEYSWVFVHFMEEFCKTTAMKEKFNLSTNDKYPISEETFLGRVEKYLHKYVFEDGKEWEFKSDKQLEEERREREEQEKLDAELKRKAEKFDPNKEVKEGMKAVKDNFDSRNYQSLIIREVPSKKEIKPEIKEPEPTVLEEVVVVGFNPQMALRRLRHEYCHWSSTRDWFGMDPSSGGFFSGPEDNRKRKFH